MKDVVEAVVKALSSSLRELRFLTRVGKMSISINTLTRYVCKVLGKDLKVMHVAPREGDVLHSYGDPTKTQKVLGFNARVDFEDGLNRFLARAD